MRTWTRMMTVCLGAAFGMGLSGCDTGTVPDDTATCTTHASFVCSNGGEYWKDSCGAQEELKQTCACGCLADGSACATDCCTPDCGTRECGAVPNGCGESCGSCGANATCDAAGACVCDQGYEPGEGGCVVQTCTPDCGTRVCGAVPNGCGESCGTCGSNATCDAAGACVCDPGYEPGEGGCVPDADCSEYVFDDVSFVTGLALLPATQGFDLDGDGTLDNNLGAFAALATFAGLDMNNELATAIHDGYLCLLLEHRGLENAQTNAAYSLVLESCYDQVGTWDDWSTGTGQFNVLRDSLSGPVCLPLEDRTFQTSAVVGGEFTSEKTTLQGLSILDGVDIPLHGVRLEATLSSLAAGGVGVQAVVGGHARKDEVLAALQAFVAAGGELPMEPATIVGMLTADIDHDGDGTMDSISAAMSVQGTSATVRGVVDL